jgi:hypothetical protein|tara:strand:+ start:729 stop:1031 length:303 start_codon:yes stop_codon:yes gene_type:complete
MSEFLKALQDLSPLTKKKHFVTIQGKTVEVSLKRSLEVLRHGADAYIWQGNEFVLKPKPKTKTTYRTLQKDTRGYDFLDGDIHWPNKIIDGGVTWQRESE